MFTRSDD